MTPFLLAIWLAAGAAGAVPSHAVILLYHHVDASTPASTSTAPEIFAAQLTWLQEHDYRVAALPAVVDSLRRGRALPDRTVVLTFDDGYVSVYHEAFPRLRSRGWPFTVFVCPEAIDEGGRHMLDWDQLREMAAAGATIASHGLRHEHLQRRRSGEDEAAWRSRLRRELVDAEQRFATELGAASGLFAYPYGEFDPDLRALVIEQGWAGFGQQSGPVGEHSDLAALPRFPLTGPHGGMDAFAEKVQSLPLPVLAAEPKDPRLPPGDPETRRPVLKLRLPGSEADWPGVTAFASNQGKAVIRWDPEAEGRLLVQAWQPLTRGRNRYNVTAPSPWPGRWYWYSHTWIVGEEHEN